MVADKFASYANADYYGKESMQKTKQIVLLYEGLMRFVEHAKKAIEEKDYAERFNLLQKASNVIVGLHSALDFDKGGEVSKTLGNFYSNLDLRIVNLNRSNDIAECDDIIREIKLMHDAWVKIDSEHGNSNESAGMTPYGAAPTEGSSSGSNSGADFSA